MNRILPLALFALLAACGDNNSRFLIQPVAEVKETRVGVSTIEVREVSLPAYAGASEIVVEQPDGSLRTVKKALWADEPLRAVTGTLARSIDLRSTATVAAEPWPLADPAQVRLEIRVDRMIARANNTFELTGQFAIAAPFGGAIERVERFEISVPLADDTPASVANATGLAIDELALKIIARLKR